MKPAQLLDHFDRISEAPDAMPDLRRFILDLAVRGKLVEQDTNAEPASGLLKQIQATKAGLVNEGRIKRVEEYAAVDPRERWCAIPSGWLYVRLGALTNIVMGQSPPGSSYNKAGEGVPLINGPVEFSEGPFGTTIVNQYTTEPTNFSERGDLLLCVRGSTTGRTNIAAIRACIGRGVAAIQPMFDDRFVRLCVHTLRQSIIGMGRGIAFPSISRHQIESLVIPLPPLAEQYRIVTKVDELMALCDRLEGAQAERERKRNRLTAASLHRLNQPADASEVAAFRNHARFHISHLSRFTTRPDQIAALRQTILGLAVRGRLVPHDSTDEPASALLERIHAEKTQLLMNGQIKRLKSAPAVVDSRLTIDWPQGWEIQSLQSLCISISDGDHQPPPKTDRGVPFLVIGNVRWRSIDFNGCRHVSNEYYRALDSVRRPQKGDILYTLVGSFGIPVMVSDDRPFCIQRHIGILRPSTNVDIGFLARVLGSRFVFDQASACATGIAQKTVPLAGLRALQIPLPPLLEQARIASKVNELMAVCDQLEAQLTGAQAKNRRLLEAVLHEALDSAA